LQMGSTSYMGTGSATNIVSGNTASGGATPSPPDVVVPEIAPATEVDLHGLYLMEWLWA